MKTQKSNSADGSTLADIRVLAMRESLEALGRFDPQRARDRFLLTFSPDSTFKVIDDGEIVAFYTIDEHDDHIFVKHLYVLPACQGKMIGSKVIQSIIKQGVVAGKAIQLRALKGSRSNRFYQSHGFVKIRDEEFDNYYEFAFSGDHIAV